MTGPLPGPLFVWTYLDGLGFTNHLCQGKRGINIHGTSVIVAVGHNKKFKMLRGSKNSDHN